MTDDDFLTSAQASAEYPILGTSAALAERRWRGNGPDYIKTTKSNAGRVFYRRSAIERWLEECTVPAAEGWKHD